MTESSRRPPAVFKKLKAPGHVKNSMSTHVKNQDNYFYTKEDEFEEDIDEFPPTDSRGQTTTQKSKATDKENEEKESSVFKYKEYKKMYFDDSKKAINFKPNEANYVTEQNKYAKLLNNHFSKATANNQVRRKKNKSDYFNDSNPVQNKPSVYKFDICSSEPKSSKISDSKPSTVKHSRKSSEKDSNVIISKKPSVSPKIQKRPHKYSEQKQVETSPEEIKDTGSFIIKSSLVSFENTDSKPVNKQSIGRNEDSYEIMELNSFNEIKDSDELDEAAYDDTGLYGVFNEALENKHKIKEDKFGHDNIFDESMERIPTVESAATEQMSPRTKQVYKITKHITQHFKENGE